MAAATCLTLSNCGGGNNDNEKSMFADDSVIIRSEEFGYALLEGHFHSVTLVGSDGDFFKYIQINKDGGYETMEINQNPKKEDELEEGEIPKAYFFHKGQPWYYKNEAKNVSILELRGMTAETTQSIVKRVLTLTWLSETELRVETHYSHEGTDKYFTQTMTLIETPKETPVPADSL